MVRCVDCKKWDLRGAADMAHHGFGRCPDKMAAQTTSGVWPRVCTGFVPASPEAVETRLNWIDAQHVRLAKRLGVDCSHKNGPPVDLIGQGQAKV